MNSGNGPLVVQQSPEEKNMISSNTSDKSAFIDRLSQAIAKAREQQASSTPPAQGDEPTATTATAITEPAQN